MSKLESPINSTMVGRMDSPTVFSISFLNEDLSDTSVTLLSHFLSQRIMSCFFLPPIIIPCLVISKTLLIFLGFQRVRQWVVVVHLMNQHHLFSDVALGYVNHGLGFACILSSGDSLCPCLLDSYH